MNDEIKDEIFMMYDLAGDKDLIYYEAIQRIIDYIADLEQENERLKEENKHIFANVNDDELLRSNAMNWAEAQDYKSRIEKAVEILKRYTDNESNYYVPVFELLNILNGKE